MDDRAGEQVPWQATPWYYYPSWPREPTASTFPVKNRYLRLHKRGGCAAPGKTASWLGGLGVSAWRINPPTIGKYGWYDDNDHHHHHHLCRAVLNVKCTTYLVGG